MAMVARLWSLSGLAVELNGNPRTLSRRLKHTRPDGKLNGNPAWLLSTAICAMKIDQPRRGGATDEIGADLMKLAHDFQAGLVQMRAEPSLARRRELAKEFGPLIGALDRKLQASLGLIPEDERTFIRKGTDQITREAIGELLRLCSWKLTRGA
jgi:hypothetical protein